jgi:H2-forming N5,N10-methylenetetrahydromethanopterin dehydrogenase-like enzyme
MIPADWTQQALGWARQRLFQDKAEVSSNFLRLMNQELPFGGGCMPSSAPAGHDVLLWFSAPNH